MGDANPPSLAELGDDEPLPNYWAEETTITVRRVTKARLDEHREGRPWDEYLEQLRREHADPLTISGVEEIADQLADCVEETGGIGPEQIAREVAKQLDYAELSKAVADEVEARLR